MFELDFYGTLVAASLVLLLGRGLVARIGFLRTYNIPEPVAGGLVVALAFLALRSVSRSSMDQYCGPSSRNLPPWYIVVTSSLAGNSEVSGNRCANCEELSFGL